MIHLPIVDRELRVAARRPAIWWLRLSATLLGLALLAVLLVAGVFDPPHGGRDGLRGLGIIMLGLAALSGCFLTADSISAERREGTLGLLFLTPLRPRDIVLGKLAVSGLTMTFCLVALLPLLFVTMLVGGVEGMQAVRLAVTILTTLLLSLGVGLLVSALSVDSTRAAMTTLVIMALATLVPMLVTAVWGEITGRKTGFNLLMAFSPAFSLMFGLESRRAGAVQQHFWYCVVTQALLGLALVGSAAGVLARNWRRELQPAAPPASGKTAARAKQEGPCGGAANPYHHLTLGQLQDPGWARWFRRFTWVVLSLMCAFLVLMRNPDLDVFLTVAMLAALTLHLLTGLTLALESARITHSHLHSGAYEQLLATPLPPLLIVTGLKTALARRFRGPVRSAMIANLVVLAAVILYVLRRPADSELLEIVGAFLIGGLMTSAVNCSVLQWAGIHRGLRDRTPLRAAFKTLVVVHGLPWVAFFVVFIILVNASISQEWVVGACFFAYYLASAAYAILLGLGLRLKVKRQFRELVAAGS